MTILPKKHKSQAVVGVSPGSGVNATNANGGVGPNGNQEHQGDPGGVGVVGVGVGVGVEQVGQGSVGDEVSLGDQQGNEERQNQVRNECKV